MRRSSSVSNKDLGLVLGAEPLVRIAPRKFRAGLPGDFPTRKGTKRSLRVKNLLEMDALGHFEVDPEISLVAAFAHRLTWWDPQADGGLISREYVPTLTMRRKDGTVLVVDVRSSSDAADPRWRRTSSFIKADYLDDHGIEFLGITELGIRVEPRHSNVKRMLQSRMLVRDDAALGRVRTVVHSNPLPTTVDRVAKLSGLPNPYGCADPSFACLVEMVLVGEVDFDMSEPLGPDTRVSLHGVRPPDA